MKGSADFRAIPTPVKAGFAAALQRVSGEPLQRPFRPGLTAVCEWTLRRVAGRSAGGDPTALPRIPGRLLVVKVHGMGDAVMVRLLVEHLHHRHPELEIGVLAGASTSEVMGFGSRFRVHSYEQRGLNAGAILRGLGELRRCRYDAVLNLEQGSLAGTAFLRAAGIPIRVGFVPLHDGTKAGFLTMPLRFREDDSMWASFIRATRLIDPDFPEVPPIEPLPLGEEARRSAKEWIAQGAQGEGERVVALHLGSGSAAPFKRWPIERFVTLAGLIRAWVRRVRFVLTGMPYEGDLVEQFCGLFRGSALDASALGSVEKTAAVLTQCDLLVSNDTGVMHLGAAVGTPTVGIFGPETPLRYCPIGHRATAVYAKGVPCSPCFDMHRLRAPLGCANPEKMLCLRGVSVEDVLDAARRVVVGGWLGEPGRRGEGG